EDDLRKELINESLLVLNERELDIIQTRKLSDKPTTLEELSAKYDISRERVRQIEVRALEKVKEALEKEMSERKIIDI
ncbi:MAG: sigma factor-like helix-turn-helix DNA-binding protein, partial [Alphaproteobacteria bacterium]